MSLREIAPRYQLNTWLSDTPAAVLDAVSGLFVMPVAYSSAANASSRFEEPAHVRFGARRLDGSRLELDVEHAGSRFRLSYAKSGPYHVTGELRAVELGEWGLRTWLNLLVGFRSGSEGAEADARPRAGADGTITAEAPGRALALTVADAPVFVTLHDSVEDFEADLEEHGYYADDDALRAGAEPATAKVVALRFNLEATPVVRFSLAVGADVERALARSRADDGPHATRDAHPSGDVDEALAAVDAVLGWNSVLDPANGRWYTAPTRAWIGRKFGGWFTWLDDTFFHAHLAAALDAEAARRNLEVALSSATPEGNLACLLSPRTRWLDRSQSPIGGLVAWSAYLRTGDVGVLDRALPTLVAAFDWWLRERRDEASGLLSFGTSTYGHGAFKGTALAARDESFMDNSPLHDGVELDPASRRLRQLDVGLSSLLALEGEMLARIARRLGERDLHARLAGIATGLKRAIDRVLWDEEAGIYVNVDLDGTPSKRIGPTSFYPLLAGVPSRERAERMVRGQLLDERAFWGPHVLPTIRRDDPAFGDNVYWRGRIWPPTNYLVYLGLRRYGLTEAATGVADRSYAMFAAEWREHGHCHENYHAVTGEGHDSKDSDGFYGWGALLPLMRVEEAIFPSPWEGLSVATGRGPCHRGTLWAGRTLRLEGGGTGGDGAWKLTLDGRPVLAGDVACRLSGLQVENAGLELIAESEAGVHLTVPRLTPERVLHAALPEGARLTFTTDGARLALPPGRNAARLALSRTEDEGDDGA